jgi:pimeloyl-ACP methyl ester carboxylesterase
MIALDLVIRHPGRCVAVAALNAVFHRSDEARRAVRERAASLAASASEDLAAAPVARWFGPSPSTQTAAAAGACRAWLAGADREGYACAYRVFAAEDGPADEALARLPIPALFVTGAMDLNSTPTMARRMASMAPRGRASIIEDAGHMAQMTHAHEINRTLAAFFQPRSC